MQELKTQSNRIEKKLETLDRIKETITQQSDEIKQMKIELHDAKNQIKDLTTENERLEREIKRCNLIISGVEDSDNENEQNCFRKVKHILSSAVDMKEIDIDTAYRLGSFQTGKTRPIKIRLLRQSDKQTIWSQRRNLPGHIYMNEDLPKSTRNHHYLLRQAAREAKAQNKNFEIDWQKKEITIDNHVSKIEDDVLISTKDDSKSKPNFFRKAHYNQKKKTNHTQLKNTDGLLRICHLNINSLSYKIFPFLNFMSSNKFSIACLSETKLFNINLPLPPDLQILRNDRTNKGGGVAIIISKLLKCQMLTPPDQVSKN